MNKLGNLVLSFLVLLASLTGCTHRLAIKNLDTYRNTSLMSLEQPLRVGIQSNSPEIEGKRLVKEVGESLNKYNVIATGVLRQNHSNVDVVSTITVHSDHKGSGWNFLINFPGFLVWAPAWHGYVYEITHRVNVALTDAKTGKQLKSFDIPIALDIRHAAFNRTWTEVSWFEWGVIAFVGGVYFIQYDDSVTPLVSEKAGPVLADYIAHEIANCLHGVQPSVRTSKNITLPVASAVSLQPLSEDVVQKKLKILNDLFDQGLVTQEEYETHRKAVVKGMSASSVAKTNSSSDFTITDFEIVTYDFDSNTGEGIVTVDMAGKGFKARLWIVKNIGVICSSKNVVLDSGNESFSGARYTILNECIKDGLLTISFQATY